MIRINLETLVMGNIPGMSMMILRPFPKTPYHDRLLPICIGMYEAGAIGKAINKEKNSRPLPHSLLLNTITQLGGKLSYIIIDKVQGATFYATLVIQRVNQTFKIDARPSDAVALALRMKVPMYVDEKVLISASFPAWVNTEQGIRKAEEAEFHKFVSTLEPEDFSN